jgi:hypothetical protein
MKLTFKDFISEGDVIKGNFGRNRDSKAAGGEVKTADFSKGKGVDNPGISIPKGYDRFEADGKKIIGIKGDKRTVVSTSTSEKLVRELVKIYNGGKSELTLTPITMTDAFGSSLMVAMQKEHVNFVEKPGYWEELDEKPITELKLRRLEKIYKEQTGHRFKVYSASEVFGISAKPPGPLLSTRKMPSEDNCIITFNDGTKYLVDTTQANTYIRMWLKVV